MALKPYVKWTHDCQGKQDYDGPVIDISTRYWPRGGGMMIFRDGREEPPNAEIRPSAHASILLRHGGAPEEGDGGPDCVTLRDARFEADTEEHVKSQIEAWVVDQFYEIAAMFGVEAK